MRALMDTVQFDDYCSSLILLAILFCVGNWIVGARPTVRTWGIRLGYLTFVVCVCARIATDRRFQADTLLRVAIYSLLVAAFVICIAWIVLPPLSALHGLTFGRIPALFRNPLRKYHESRKQRAERARLNRERRRADQEWQRSAGDREREQLAAEQRARDEAAAQKRRDDARTKCRMLYDTWAPDIGDRFPREQFQEYVTDYLDDRHPPEYVEERAMQLNDLIRQHIEKVDPAPQITSLAQLRRWFEDRKTEIQLEPDEKLQRNLMARLKKRYDELAAQLMEDLPP